jgi:hypothetical protein
MEDATRQFVLHDYVRDIAKAVGENRPIQELGQRAIDKIESEQRAVNEIIGILQQQIYGIRTLMQLYPEKVGATVTVVPGARAASTATAPPAAPDLTTPPAVNITGGLTEAQRLRVMELAVEFVRERGSKAPILPEDFLALLNSKGVRLPVQHPRSVAGTFLYRAKERVKKNGHGPQGSLLPPVEFGKPLEKGGEKR